MPFDKESVCALLKEEGIPFTRQEHPAIFTMEEMEALHLPGEADIAKNLFLRDDKKQRYYLVSMYSDRRADLKALRAAMGSRPLSFASEEDLFRLLALKKGSVTPLGALNDAEKRVCVFLDPAFRGGRIGVHPNDNTATLFLPADELLALLRRHGTAAEYLDT